MIEHFFFMSDAKNDFTIGLPQLTYHQLHKNVIQKLIN